MLGKPKKHLYQQILQADPRACQVRTYDNKILYTNAKGTLLLGLRDDPFTFLSEYNPQKQYSDLLTAYQHHLPFSSTFENGKNILSVQLFPLIKATLIAITDKTIPQKSYHVLESQLDVLSEAVRSLDVPVYLCDEKGIFLYANPAFMEETDLDLSEIIGKSKENIISNKNIWSEKEINAAEENLILGVQKVFLHKEQDTENSPIPTLLLDTKDYLILGANVSAVQTLGKNLNELVGHDFEDLWENSFQKSLKDVYRKIEDDTYDNKPIELRLNLEDFKNKKIS